MIRLTVECNLCLYLISSLDGPVDLAGPKHYRAPSPGPPAPTSNTRAPLLTGQWRRRNDHPIFFKSEYSCYSHEGGRLRNHFNTRSCRFYKPRMRIRLRWTDATRPSHSQIRPDLRASFTISSFC